MEQAAFAKYGLLAIMVISLQVLAINPLVGPAWPWPSRQATSYNTWSIVHQELLYHQ